MEDKRYVLRKPTIRGSSKDLLGGFTNYSHGYYLTRAANSDLRIHTCFPYRTTLGFELICYIIGFSETSLGYVHCWEQIKKAISSDLIKNSDIPIENVWEYVDSNIALCEEKFNEHWLSIIGIKNEH